MRTAGTISYARWSDLLFERFHADSANESLFLHVDDAVLNEIADDEGVDDGVTSLVRSVVIRCNGPCVWGMQDIQREMNQWELAGYDGSPPCLPVLGLTVLAATRMRRGIRESGEKVAATNYFRRLNDLVDRPLDAGKPDWMDEVRSLWVRWENWLKHAQGRWGHSTLPQAPRHRNVARPVSQALWRQSDNRLVRMFLSAQGWVAGGVIPKDQVLLDAARRWAQDTLPGPRADFIGDTDNQDAVLALLHAAARLPALALPRGVVMSDSREPRADLRLMISAPPARRIGLFATRPPSWPALVMGAAPDGTNYTLDAADALLYRIDGPVTEAVLREGLALELEDGRRVTMRGHTEYAFQDDPICGAYGVVDELLLSANFLLLTPKRESVTLLDDLDRLGLRHRPLDVAGCPPGWGVWQCKGMSGASEPLPLWISHLMPSAVPRLLFSGGLHPDARLSTYLTGHAPRVEGTPGAEVMVDDIARGLVPPSGEFDLVNLGLDAGEHYVRVGESGSTIRMVDQGTADAQSKIGTRGQRWMRMDGDLVWQGAGEGAESDLVIAGADVPVELQGEDSRTGRVVVVNVKKDLTVLGCEPGQVHTEKAQGSPASWLKRAELETTDTGVRIPFQPVWCVERGALGACTAPADVGLPGPGISESNADSAQAWAEAICAAPPPAVQIELWEQYVQAAGRLLGQIT